MNTVICQDFFFFDDFFLSLLTLPSPLISAFFPVVPEAKRPYSAENERIVFWVSLALIFPLGSCSLFGFGDYPYFDGKSPGDCTWTLQVFA